jgi:LacI family transcriptional regulator
VSAALFRKIASEVGVSAQTVQRVLTQELKDTRPSIVKRSALIREIARRHRYRPNAAAQAIASGKFDDLTLIIGGTKVNSGFGWLSRELLEGATEAAQSVGMTLTIADVSDDKLTDSSFMPRVMSSWCTDGLLINYIVQRPAALDSVIAEHLLPAVFLNTKLPTNSVYPDDIGGAKLAVETLCRMGHRKIGYIGWRPDNKLAHYSEKDRHDGYLQAMRDAGLSPRMALHGVSDTPEQIFSLDDPRDVLTELDEPTAVIVLREIDAQRVAMHAARRGWRVPKDLSIVMFLNEPRITGPTYAGVQVAHMKVGELGVDMVRNRIAQKGESMPSVMVPSTWFEGMSVAKPRMRAVD